MKIEHIAIWTSNLERLKDFYRLYFEASCGDRYSNPKTGFQSYFLTFASGARLELMSMSSVDESPGDRSKQYLGLVHISFSVGSEQAVNDLTRRIEQDGFKIWDGPRWTGDGYYESQVSDPDGNRIEITI